MNDEKQYMTDCCNDGYIRRQMLHLQVRESLSRDTNMTIEPPAGYDRCVLDGYDQHLQNMFDAEHKCLLKVQKVLKINSYKSKIVAEFGPWMNPQLVVDLKPPSWFKTLKRGLFGLNDYIRYEPFQTVNLH